MIKIVYGCFNHMIGIVSGVFGIIEYIHSNIITKTVFLVFAFVYLFFLVYKVAKNIKQYFDAKKAFSAKLLYIGKYLHKCSHNIRDNMGYNDKDISNREFFINICKSTCNDIQAVIASVLNDDKVSISIKRIITEKLVDTDYLNWQVETIARCSKSDPKRENDSQPKKIADNSYLEIIVSPDYLDTAFIAPDLTNISHDFIEEYEKKYTNGTKDFLKYYKSTIVIPIRIDAKRVCTEISETIPSDLQYYVIGFLCIDSLRTYDTEHELFQVAVDIAKSISDNLYKLFEKNIVATMTKGAK